MEALDTNHDGTLSAEEIANASASLKKLDKNGDGKLTSDELRPSGRRGGRGGFGQGRNGGGPGGQDDDGPGPGRKRPGGAGPDGPGPDADAGPPGGQGQPEVKADRAVLPRRSDSWNTPCVSTRTATAN